LCPVFLIATPLTMRIQRLDLDHAAPGFDLFQLIELALAAAGADAAGVLPIVGRLEIGFPERPGAALTGPGLINGAPARLTVQKDTIAVGKLLQALSHSNSPAVIFFEIIGVQTH